MLTFGQVTYQNFGPFENATFRFDQPGLTLVSGRMTDRPGADDNGAGKSMVLEGLVFALYGRCLRDRFKGDDIIRHGAKWAAVSVEIKGLDQPAHVFRFRGHPSFGNNVRLCVGDQDVSRGRNAATQQEIDQLVGMDYATFVSTVAFGARQDIRSFFALPEADRKGIFETLLGLEVFARAEVLARAESRETAGVIAGVEAQAASVVQRQEDLARLRETLPDIDGLQAAVDACATALRKAAEAGKKADREVRESRQAVQDALADYRRELADYRVKEADAIERGQGLYQVETQAKGALQAATRGRDALVQERGRLTNLRGSRCPTCKTRLTAEVQQEVLAENSAAQEKAAQVVLAAEAAYEAAAADYGQATEELVAIKKKAPKDPDIRAESRRVTESEDQQRKSQALIRQEASAHAAAKSELDEAVRTSERISELEARIAQDGAEAQQRLVTLRDRQKVSDFWVAGFGDGGVKSFIVESALPAINEHATALAQRLLGAGSYVRLTATKALKSKPGEQRERMEVEGCIPGYATSYAAASKGQRLRLDLALLLAFREVAARRAWKQVRQFLADELFDGLDRSGCAMVATMLRELSQEAPVILVTHDERLKGWADRQVVVHHDGTKARILADKAKVAGKK
jgi:DNA repair exonuclease SbcCD ATPase subunit